MSTQQEELLKAMGKENVAIQQATAETPPQLQNMNPELDDMGLDALRVHMSENAYNTFLTLLHWATVCQKMSDGEELVWGDEMYACMGSPFTGFGNPFLWESTYTDNVAKMVHFLFMNWHTDGARERAANKLPHRLLKELAPVMANQSKGWAHMGFVKDLVADPKLYKQL